jgi:hypothetical protein
MQFLRKIKERLDVEMFGLCIKITPRRKKESEGEHLARVMKNYWRIYGENGNNSSRR